LERLTAKKVFWGEIAQSECNHRTDYDTIATKFGNRFARRFMQVRDNRNHNIAFSNGEVESVDCQSCARFVGQERLNKKLRKSRRVTRPSSS
jgi:hypothetical protein